jgi:A/G-specific adenine glycosylase
MSKNPPDFSKSLISWYLQNKRSLPWRETKDPYLIWLSEIILQQTRVAQGLPYYNKFVSAYPTVFDLAGANETDVLKIWQGLGYYSRARNLHHSAQFIASELNGVFPKTAKDLIKLRGIGDYTASAIASICYDEASAVVDGNVYRVLSRVFGIETPINSSVGIKQFKELAQELIDPEQPGTFNQAIMEFGARHCTPSGPDCMNCIFSNKCWALKHKTITQLPVKINKTKIKVHHFNFMVPLTNDGKTMMHQRLENGIWKNLYQFPLIDHSKQLTKASLLKNPYFQTIISPWIVESLTRYNEQPILHKLSHKDLYITFWIVRVANLPADAISFREVAKHPVPIVLDRFISEFGPFQQ